ncbi:LEXM protein, partial [Turnix velox]|nr:LEXM protein [Turnix velox]
QHEQLGPGTYNLRDFLQETHPCSLRGICDTREQRFRDGHRDCFPGPGTYGPQGNPYTLLEERDKRSASTVGLMDSRTTRTQPLTSSLLCLQGSGLGPGTYNLRSSIDEGLWRAKGSVPHQPFSGDRSKPAGGGHHALEVRCLGRKGTELSSAPVKGFLEELMLRENKKKGCFSTLPRNPGCPTERIFWATLSQCPKEEWAVGPGSYDPKPIEKSKYSGQAPFWSSAKRFDRKYYQLFTQNENPVGVGRYDITKHENYPQKTRYQSLYQCDTQRYLSNLKQDAYFL